MSKRENATCRFYARDDVARTRSSLWRVWVGRDGQDVYVAPSRIAGEFKFSAHRDGMNQLGYYGDVRNEIRAADSHFLKRWKRTPAPFLVQGWETLCAVVLDPLEFESVGLREDPAKPMTAMNAPPNDQVICVFVLSTDDRLGASDLELVTLATFPRGEKGETAVVVAPIDREPSSLATVDADRQGFGWEAPARRGLNEPWGFVFGIGHAPIFSEYSSRKHQPPPIVPHLAGLKGSTATWESVPTEVAGTDVFCGVLACSPTSSTLYVDARAHCNHDHLVSDANDLIDAFHLGLIDGGWSRLADGRLATAITMRATAEAAGLTHYFPNPMKKRE